MTSACVRKDTLRNDTQVFHKFRDSIFEIFLDLIKLQLHLLLPTFIDAEPRRGNIKRTLVSGKWIIITQKTDHSSIFTFPISCFYKII